MKRTAMPAHWRCCSIGCDMGNAFAGLMAGLFVALCMYSLDATKHGRVNRTAHAKPVMIWRDKKAATLADVYGITPEEADKPIAIFGR